MHYIIALIFLAFASPASAQTNWTGFHGGIHAGLDLTQTEASLGGLGIDSLGSDGWQFGIHGGYDWQMPGSALVLGIGVDYTWSNTEFSVSPGILSAELEDSWSVYVRAGHAMGHVLPYALVGYTRADASASFFGVSAGDTTLDGWVLGSGIELMLAPNISVVSEYRYTRFDDLNFGGPGGLDLETDRHEIRTALRYRFGHSHASYPEHTGMK